MRETKRSSRMRKIVSVFILLSCIVFLLPVFPEEGNDRLTVGVPADRCPVFYSDRDTGEIAGIGVDLMRLAAKEAGYAVTFVPIGENTLPEALDNPAYDLVLPFGSAVPSASGQATVVSENLTQTPFTLVTEGSQGILSLDDLRVGMLRSNGGVAATVRERFPRIEITLYETMAESVQALHDGKVDALLNNSYVWSYVLQKPAYAKLNVQQSAMVSMDFRAGTPDTPAGREIISRLNAGIAKITDPYRQAIVLDYTTRRLYQYDFQDYVDAYGVVILLGLCLLVSIVLIVLEKQHTMRLEQEEKMRQLIDHDPLTGALSREGFRKRVEELLRAHPDNSYILVYANIRNFKYINDSLGMAAGDELLRFWARKSKEVLSAEEAFGRTSADHFTILCKITTEDQLNDNDRHVLDSVRTYFIDQGKENRVQVCCGIYVLTLEDYHEIRVDHMLDYARVAERRVRETRGDGFELYNPEQWARGKRVTEVINQLPSALRSREILVWYQPQVDAETGKIIGAEALCRWNHSKLGWLQPPAFIETLEESGMIYDLDRYVWNRVCEDLHRWNGQGHRRSVSVNVSRRDIREKPDLADHFRDLVRKYSLDPSQLRIEITETAFVENSADLISATKKLREYGFEVEMDDFGSGHSSLHMLKEVPVDRIKLDLHFLTESGDPEKGRIIVSHIIQMVRSLGMKMIAEGVETEEQARFLRNTGCTAIQGFFYYKPMSVEDFESLA